MSHALNVLHVAQPGDGGVAGYVAAAAADQLARGWDVAVAAPPDTALAESLARHGVPHLPWRAQRSPGTSVPGEARRLGRLVARRRPDLVHLHSSKAGLAGRLLLRGRLPTLFQPHGWSWLAAEGALGSASLAWERSAARWASGLVCVGAGEAAEGRASRVRGRYVVVRNGVDLRRFRPADGDIKALARARLGIAADVPLCVCVGRLTRQKGQDVLLEAWQRVGRQWPVVGRVPELALVGDGDLADGLRAAAGPSVRFVGAVEDVRTWLAAADLVALPSRWEGLPLTALEALATGRPVVASAVAGLTEVVAPSVGVLVPVADPHALAEALTRRLSDRDLCRAEGREAVRHAGRFDLRRTFDRLAEVTVEAARGEHLRHRSAVAALRREQRAW